MADNKDRLCYIEPNMIGGDNVTWNPEEYNITVNLEVEIPDRRYSGNSENRRNRQSIFSGTSSLFSNGKSYLTDSHTFIYATNAGNESLGLKEQLGIESITITYDKNMFPIVSMKMLDIRGFSLMTPAEQQTKEKFFNSLFMFPYPKFYLTVKGYLGTAVTYILAVNTFKSSFNSSVGNYDINIEFIGHMYGVYTDIPMQLLYIAPYIGTKRGETNSEWNSIVANNKIKEIGGTESGTIPTLRQITENYKNINTSVETLITGENNGFIGEIREADRHIDDLREIQDQCKQYLEALLEAGNGIVEYSTPKNINELFGNDEAKTYVGVILRNKIDNIWPSDFFKKYDVYQEKYGWSGIGPFQKESGKLETLISLEDTKDNLDKISSYLKTQVDPENVTIERLGDSDFKRHSKEVGNKDKTHIIEVTFLTELYNQANTKISDEEAKKAEVIQKNPSEIESVFENGLGFRPTIKNVFTILFAHIECFFNLFYKVINEIDTNHLKRRITNTKNTDIPTIGDNSAIEAPPFFIAKDEKTQKIARRIEEIFSSVNINPQWRYEVKFIDDIFSALTFLNLFNDEDVDNTPKPLIDNIYFTPSTIYDAVYTKNPYEGITSCDDIWGKVSEIFLERFNLYALSTGRQYQLAPPKEFCANEAKNITNVLLKSINGRFSRFKDVPSLFLSSLYKLMTNDKDKTILKGDAGYYLRYRDVYVETKLSEDCSVEKAKKYEDFKYEPLENSDSNYTKDICKICRDIEQTNIEFLFSNNGNVSFPFIEKSEADKTPYTINDISKSPDDKNVVFPYFKITDENNNVIDLFKGNNLEKISNGDKFLKWLYILSVFYNQKKERSILSWGFDKLFDTDELIKMPKFELLFIGGLMFLNQKKCNYAPIIGGLALSPFVSIKTEKEKYKKVTTHAYDTTYLKPIDWIVEYFTDFVESKEAEGLLKLFTEKDNTVTQKELGKLYTEDIIILGKGRNEIKTPKIVYLDKAFAQLYVDIKENLDKSNKNTEENSSEEESTVTTTITDEQRLSLYLTLKNLYDKWLSTYKQETFRLSSNESQFKNFMFVDSFYQDISDDMLVNPENFNGMIKDIEDGKNYTFYQFFTNLAHDNKLLFMPLPVYNGKTDRETIKNILSPHFSNFIGTGNTLSKFVFMYTNKPAEKIAESSGDKNRIGYADDGIYNLKDFVRGDGDNVVAFGINVGQQNQSIFKNVTITMDTPRETEEAIRNTLNLAQKSTAGATTSIRGTGQDLFSIYSNRAYDCRVDMLGCANITPGMYFQLNNVPMFHGAYMIYKVEHKIDGNNMSTSFVGQKISSNRLPFNRQCFNVNSLITQITEKIYSFSDEEVNYAFSKSINVNKKYGITRDTVYNVGNAITRMNGSFNIGEKYIPCAYTNKDSQHVCAGVVMRCVAAGLGIDYEKVSKKCNGFACNELLTSFGFSTKDEWIWEKAKGNLNEFTERIDSICMPGDIAVIARVDKDPGHICMYCTDGSWHSDFKQNTMKTYEVDSDIKEIRLYRFGGKIKPAQMQTGSGVCKIVCGGGLKFENGVREINVMSQNPKRIKVYSDDGYNFDIKIRDNSGKLIPDFCYEKKSQTNSIEVRFYSVNSNLTIEKS